MKFDSKGNNPAFAIGYLFKGLRLVTSHELRAFIIIPIVINIVLYSLALMLGYYYISDLITQFIPSWLQWLSWVLWPLFFISFFYRWFFLPLRYWLICWRRRFMAN